MLPEGFFFDDSTSNYSTPVLDGPKNFWITTIHEMFYVNTDKQGKVMLEFTVDKSGGIQNISVIQGIDIALDKEAMRIIRTVKFSAPAKKDGKPIELCVRHTVAFRLN